MSMPRHDRRCSTVDILCAYTPFFSGYLGLVWFLGRFGFGYGGSLRCDEMRCECLYYYYYPSCLLGFG
jgi:hypothetical protein